MASIHKELTAYQVNATKAPEKGTVFVRDTLLKGLALRVTHNGSKAFIVEAWVNGRSRRVTLGKHPALSLKDARKKAREVIGSFASGRDVVAERINQKALRVTLATVYGDYMASRDLKPRTVDDYAKVMRLAFSDWQSKPITSITRNRVEKRHHQMGENSPSSANKAMRVLRALFNFAIGKYEKADGSPIITDNPTKRLSATRSWYPVERKRTLIRPEQLPQWFEAVLTLKPEQPTSKADVVRDYLLLLILTGLRREEAARLPWCDVDLKAKVLIIRDTKNRQPHELPLTDYLHQLLSQRKQQANGSRYVFAGEGKGGYLVEPKRWLQKVTQQSGVAFTIHDLRRTFITIAESLDIPAYALKRLLNHKSGGDVTAGYIIMDVERLREPMQRITDFILKAGGVKKSAAVVSLFDSKKSH